MYTCFLFPLSVSLFPAPVSSVARVRLSFFCAAGLCAADSSASPDVAVPVRGGVRATACGRRSLAHWDPPPRLAFAASPRHRGCSALRWRPRTPHRAAHPTHDSALTRKTPHQHDAHTRANHTAHRQRRDERMTWRRSDVPRGVVRLQRRGAARCGVCRALECSLRLCVLCLSCVSQSSSRLSGTPPPSSPPVAA